jgi:tetratricopeptide (TPR) repeat protein
MARIPLVTEFEGKGLDRAIKEFKKLEGAGAKASFALKKAFVPATAALAGLTAAAGLSVKAAIEDTAQQAELARTLKATTDATTAQVEAVESYIAETEKAVAVSDAELRPAFANLVRATGDVTQAQELMTLALDVAAATGKDLETVTEALQEGFQGEVGPLKELDKSLTDMIASGASADEVMAQLAETFGGAAQESTETLEGRFKLMKIELDNAKEAIGMALLPVLEQLLPILESVARFVGENTDLIVILGSVIAVLAGAIIAVNFAMSAYAAVTTIATAATAVFNAVMAMNPIGLIVIAVASLIALFVVLQKKFNIIGLALRGLKAAFYLAWNGIRWVINNIIDGLNDVISLLNIIPGVDIPELGHLGKSADEAAERIDHLANKSLRALDYEAEQLAEDSLPKLLKSIHGVRLEGGELRSTLGRVNEELDPFNEGIETATSRLDAFFDSLDQQAATEEFIEDLTDIAQKLAGVTEGSEAWQEAQNEAYEALRTLREEREDLSDAFFEVLKLEIDTGDLDRAMTLMQQVDEYLKNNFAPGFQGLAVPVTGYNVAQALGAVPMFADGGIVTGPTLGIVGEAGPEAIIPLDQMGRMGGMNVTINMPAGTNGDDIIQALENYQRYNGAIPLQVDGSTFR